MIKKQTYILGVVGAPTRTNRVIQAMAFGVSVPLEERWTHCALLYWDGDDWRVIESHQPQGVHEEGYADFIHAQECEQQARSIYAAPAALNIETARSLCGMPYPDGLVRHSLVKGAPDEQQVRTGIHCGQLAAQCLFGFTGEAWRVHPAEIQAWLVEREKAL